MYTIETYRIAVEDLNNFEAAYWLHREDEKRCCGEESSNYDPDDNEARFSLENDEVIENPFWAMRRNLLWDVRDAREDVRLIESHLFYGATLSPELCIEAVGGDAQTGMRRYLDMTSQMDDDQLCPENEEVRVQAANISDFMEEYDVVFGS